MCAPGIFRGRVGEERYLKYKKYVIHTTTVQRYTYSETRILILPGTTEQSGCSGGSETLTHVSVHSTQFCYKGSSFSGTSQEIRSRERQYLVPGSGTPRTCSDSGNGKRKKDSDSHAVRRTNDVQTNYIQDECQHVRGNDFMRRMHLSTWHLVHLGLNGGDRGRNSTCMKLYKYSTRYWSLECIVRYQTQRRYSTCTVSYYRKLVSIASRRGN